MKKTLEQQYKEETGLNAYEPNNMRPNIPEDVYVEWLEDKIEQLRIGGVSNRRELLRAYENWKDSEQRKEDLEQNISWFLGE